MDDLITFAKARVDEAQAAAEAMQHEGGEVWLACPATRSAPVAGCDLEWGEEQCDCGLAARKARALREVEAKRRILQLHEAIYPAVARQGSPGPATVADPAGTLSVFAYCVICDEDSPCLTLGYLTAIWSDHPDYRPAWAPATG